MRQSSSDSLRTLLKTHCLLSCLIFLALSSFENLDRLLSSIVVFGAIHGRQDSHSSIPLSEHSIQSFDIFLTFNRLVLMLDLLECLAEKVKNMGEGTHMLCHVHNILPLGFQQLQRLKLFFFDLQRVDIHQIKYDRVGPEHCPDLFPSRRAAKGKTMIACPLWYEASGFTEGLANVEDVIWWLAEGVKLADGLSDI